MVICNALPDRSGAAVVMYTFGGPYRREWHQQLTETTVPRADKLGLWHPWPVVKINDSVLCVVIYNLLYKLVYKKVQKWEWKDTNCIYCICKTSAALQNSIPNKIMAWIYRWWYRWFKRQVYQFKYYSVLETGLIITPFHTPFHTTVQFI